LRRRHVREAIWPVVICCAALSLFAWIAASVETGGTIALVDAWVAEWLHVRVWPPVTTVMIAISFLGAPSTLTAVTFVASVLLARKRSYEHLIVVLTLVLGGNLLNCGVKVLLHRGRPVFDDPLFTLPSYSFPSGHAMASTVFYGFVIALVLSNRRHLREAAIAGGTVMIMLVGLSRIYLGVHYMSDVLAGVLEAIAWSTLVLAIWRFTCVIPHRLGSRRQPK
jgi:membrane-associated phospholipid phosphatase